MFHFTCVLKVNEHNFNCLVLYHTERVRERKTKNMKTWWNNNAPTGTITCIGKSVLSYTILNSKRKGVNENETDSPTNNGERISLYLHLHLHVVYLNTVPDLPLCLGVLKHRAPLARERGVFSLSYVCLSDVICFFWEFGYYSHVVHLLVVSEWLLFNTKWAMFQLYHGENQLYSMRRWWCVAYNSYIHIYKCIKWKWYGLPNKQWRTKIVIFTSTSTCRLLKYSTGFTIVLRRA
jgi:hypothetical protein